MRPSKTSTTPDPDSPSSTPRRKRHLLLIANTALLGVVVAGVAGYGFFSKTVTLDVDGKKDTVRTFSGDVDSVLKSQDVKVADSDKLNVKPTSGVDDGDTISVAYARPLTLAVDGKVTRATTHEPTVAKALASMDVKPKADAVVSQKGSERLSRAGDEIVVSNPKKLTVVADGKKKTMTSAEPTAADVLKTAGVELDSDDQLNMAEDAYVTKNDKVVVTRIDMKAATVTEKQAPKVVYRDDDSLEKGDTKVIEPGKVGKVRQDVLVTKANGKERSRLVVTSERLSKPETKIVARGTKAPEEEPATEDDAATDSAPAKQESSPSVADGSVWDRLAQCESGGNWATNTGNGYYGGLQFSAATWHSVGGPGLPHEQSRETQIKYAKILQQRSGWGQWSCSASVGLS